MTPGEIIRNGSNIVRRRLLGEEHVVHAIVVIVVVLCVTFLGARAEIDHNTTGFVYATAIGYAAGRSGTRSPSRSGDDDRQ